MGKCYFCSWITYTDDFEVFGAFSTTTWQNRWCRIMLFFNMILTTQMSLKEHSAPSPALSPPSNGKLCQLVRAKRHCFLCLYLVIRSHQLQATPLIQFGCSHCVSRVPIIQSVRRGIGGDSIFDGGELKRSSRRLGSAYMFSGEQLQCGE